MSRTPPTLDDLRAAHRRICPHIHRTPVLSSRLLDEIAGGLTEAECHALVGTIQGIRDQGVSIIWIEHIVHALTAVVERLIIGSNRNDILYRFFGGGEMRMVWPWLSLASNPWASRKS